MLTRSVHPHAAGALASKESSCNVFSSLNASPASRASGTCICSANNQRSNSHAGASTSRPSSGGGSSSQFDRQGTPQSGPRSRSKYGGPDSSAPRQGGGGGAGGPSSKPKPSKAAEAAKRQARAAEKAKQVEERKQVRA